MIYLLECKVRSCQLQVTMAICTRRLAASEVAASASATGLERLLPPPRFRSINHTYIIASSLTTELRHQHETRQHTLNEVFLPTRIILLEMQSHGDIVQEHDMPPNRRGALMMEEIGLGFDNLEAMSC
jgi:hypothetical protein